MARHTNCCQIKDAGEPPSGVQKTAAILGAVAVAVAGVVGLIAALGLAAVSPVTLAGAATALVVGAGLIISLINHIRDYFFDHRLVCLDGDRCMIGQIVALEDDADGDQSINSVLAPATGTTTLTDYKKMPQVQELMLMDPGLASRGWDLIPEGARQEADPQFFGDGNLPLFHAEIEGTYFDDWTTAMLAFLWSAIALGVAAAALAAAELIPGAGWILAGIVALLAILGLIFGVEMAIGDQDTTSVKPDPLGSAKPDAAGPIITDVTGQRLHVNDTIAIMGRHVTDTGHHTDPNHRCWNELHPIKAITKIHHSEYDKVPATAQDRTTILDAYCQALHQFVDDSHSGQTRAALTCLEHPR